MKSQVNALLHVIQGVLTDASLAYPELKEKFAKDFSRLDLTSQNRGLGLFTLDLPHLDSLLLKGLEAGRLVASGPLSQRVSKSVSVPRIFSGLWLRVFEKDSRLKQDVDATALFFLRQLCCLGKKLEVDCSDDRIYAAVGAYHDIERKLRAPSLSWELDSICDQSGGNAGSGIERPWYNELAHSPAFDFVGCANDNHLINETVDYVSSESEADESATHTEGNDPARNLHLVQCLDGSLGVFRQSNGYLPFGSESDGAGAVAVREDQRLLTRIQQVADFVCGEMAIFDPITYSGDLEMGGRGSGFKHGPGAVAERLKGWNKSTFPSWPLKLQHTFVFEYCGKTAGDERLRPHNHEVASRLICVPKTSKGPRLIAAEPVAHQWCQQLMLKFLFGECRRLLKGSFIDFKDQSKSGDMVLEASLNKSLATVDLSDASDRLSCWTVERMFRRNPSILCALHAARTRYIRDDISYVPSFLNLKKFASQGTAVTFPVMSLTMLFIALGACIEGEVTWKKIHSLRHQVRVFGDDIIIPTHGYEQLVRAMDLLQLKVNTAKSYVNGQFRESCGVDGYLGHDVTPVKPKTIVADSPASCQAVVDTSNNLFNKGLWHASQSVLSLLPAHVQRGLRVVGKHGDGSPGLTSYSGSDERHLAKRWNTSLHRWEVRVWAILSSTRRVQRDGFSALLDFVSRGRNSEQARVSSSYADTRKAKSGFRWEPSSTGIGDDVTSLKRWSS